MNEIATRRHAEPCYRERQAYFVIGGPGTGLFLGSWLIVAGLGMLPLVEAWLHTSPELSYEAVTGFLVATGSAALLRHHYSWIGVVLHIYSQIAIWRSLTLCSMAFVFFACGG